MNEHGYERHFRALHDGATTFDEFAAATAPLWRRLAAQLHRRWRMPAWHTQEMTQQNFLRAAWEFTWQYDAAKAKRGLQAYVVWNAFDKAKKAAHKARGARLSGNSDQNPSCIERPLSSYGDDGGDDGDQAGAVERLMHASGSYVAADQEERLIQREERAADNARAWGCAATLRELRVLEVLAEADSLSEAARFMWDDEAVRVELALAAPGDAMGVVMRTVRAVAKRLDRVA